MCPIIVQPRSLTHCSASLAPSAWATRNDALFAASTMMCVWRARRKDADEPVGDCDNAIHRCRPNPRWALAGRERHHANGSQDRGQHRQVVLRRTGRYLHGGEKQDAVDPEPLLLDVRRTRGRAPSTSGRDMWPCAPSTRHICAGRWVSGRSRRWSAAWADTTAGWDSHISRRRRATRSTRRGSSAPGRTWGLRPRPAGRVITLRRKWRPDGRGPLR